MIVHVCMLVWVHFNDCGTNLEHACLPEGVNNWRTLRMCKLKLVWADWPHSDWSQSSIDWCMPGKWITLTEYVDITNLWVRVTFERSPWFSCHYKSNMNNILHMTTIHFTNFVQAVVLHAPWFIHDQTQSQLAHDENAVHQASTIGPLYISARNHSTRQPVHQHYRGTHGKNSKREALICMLV